MQTHFSTETCFLQLSLGLCATSVSAAGLPASAVAGGGMAGAGATALRCTAEGLGAGSTIGGGGVVVAAAGAVGFELGSAPFEEGRTAAV